MTGNIINFGCHHLQNDFYDDNNLTQTFEVSLFYVALLLILILLPMHLSLFCCHYFYLFFHLNEINQLNFLFHFCIKYSFCKFIVITSGNIFIFTFIFSYASSTVGIVFLTAIREIVVAKPLISGIFYQHLHFVSLDFV